LLGLTGLLVADAAPNGPLANLRNWVFDAYEYHWTTSRPPAASTYVLYFQTGSTELDPSSRDRLAAAIAAAKGAANVDISVVGHADAAGSDPYNSALSLKRAEIVRDALVGAGVSGRGYRDCLSRGEQTTSGDTTWGL
jgi:outer membrane protein OmpA-like peptidoglycan-associated protein